MKAKKIARFKSLPFNEQYAHWCAFGDPEEYHERYLIGLEDFELFVTIEGIAQVGIDWEHKKFIIGTECIEKADSAGKIRVVGHLIMWLNLQPPSYGFENLSPSSGGHHHPLAPANSSVFCGLQDGHQALVNGIVEGRPSRSWRILLAAARMETGLVTIGAYNAPLDSSWPIKQAEG